MQDIFDQDIFDAALLAPLPPGDDFGDDDDVKHQDYSDVRYPIPHRVSEIADLRRQANLLRARQARLGAQMRHRLPGPALGAAAGAGGVFHPMEIEDERKGPFDLPIIPPFAPLPPVSFFVSFFV